MFVIHVTRPGTALLMFQYSGSRTRSFFNCSESGGYSGRMMPPCRIGCGPSAAFETSDRANRPSVLASCFSIGTFKANAGDLANRNFHLAITSSRVMFRTVAFTAGRDLTFTEESKHEHWHHWIGKRRHCARQKLGKSRPQNQIWRA